MIESKIKSVKKSMLAACVKLADLGFLAGVGGNLAVRINSELMAVTPSATDYYTMKPDDLCILQIKDLKMVEGTKQPTTESGIHASFFSLRPEIEVSLHTHQPLASAVSLLGLDMEIQSSEGKKNIGNFVRIVSYAPSGTSFLVKAFRKRIIKETNGYLLRNHGLVCGAFSLDEAISNVKLLEKEAARFLKTRIEKNPNLSQMPSEMRTQLIEAL
ncbi:class II aldolase/adducin family protein [Leptospira sp. 85282-16]|uniref:Class II aldolase/adducin family protein n=1 Tax=Leptospira montravelensis TaxID=2484961 RepID=A0ABY2LUL1_9LEPT|nr:MULTISPECIES: class II aldolase/adducin family protein [Leptospira]MCT8332695.1 class II aldolase/adducin family protein [Leptospira sp. 85282-16]TGK83899.1 class II aldolase/adducin family protein [Leptospira montravelensis]TGL05906.1 class II aldolase/adducin family protein [Leptospira montravelensis]